MFSSFASSIIGFLIVALSTVGGNATINVSSTDTASTQATTTEIQIDESFMTGLANALVRLQTRFEHGSSGRGDERRSFDDSSDDNSSASSSRSHSADDDGDDDSGRGREDERRGSTSVKSERRGEVELRGRNEEGEEEFESEHGREFEDEDEDEGGEDDEDEHKNRGSSTSGTVGTAGSAGSSGSGATSGSGSTTTGGTTSTTQTALTMSVVAAHNTSASCYSAINGSVYDLTAWISKHPGGQNAIKGICGVDGSAAFNGQHGSSGSPASVLAGYKIGVLQ